MRTLRITQGRYEHVIYINSEHVKEEKKIEAIAYIHNGLISLFFFSSIIFSET
jgi:hypothetical protein